MFQNKLATAGKSFWGKKLHQSPQKSINFRQPLILANYRSHHTAQKMKFSINDFFSKCNQIRWKTVDLVTFTDEILNGKLYFLCSIIIRRTEKTLCSGTIIYRGGSRAAATSKMERFVIIVNGWKPLTIITKDSILDVAVTLDPPLI